MNKLLRVAVSAATITGIAISATGAAFAGGSGTWPIQYPLPLSPGVLLSQTSTTATVRSTDTVAQVTAKLDALYVTQKGCTIRLAVNKPKDYLCFNASTNKTDEVYFTFAALDVTATNPYRSQSNAFYVKG